ncbi:unnamed protein product [Gulo gulo]|uniref:Uncharacterized protein n=1 Tax=Gulo gulo TaxID=48420 RepID=A0A9X9LDW9_GULGU|nr:unnamed protein product [Gulo gulo]
MLNLCGRVRLQRPWPGLTSGASYARYRAAGPPPSAAGGAPSGSPAPSTTAAPARRREWKQGKKNERSQMRTHTLIFLTQRLL